jgi:sugar transferase (PEP-CTERM system associated)
MIGPVVSLLLLELLLVCGSYVTATYLLYPLDPTLYLLYETGWVRILVSTAVISTVLYLKDMYQDVYSNEKLLLLQNLLQVFGIAFLLQAFLSYGAVGVALPRWVMVYGSVAAFLGVLALRLAYFPMVVRVLPERRLLIVGFSPLAVRIAAFAAENPLLKFSVVGALSEVRKEALAETGITCLGRPADVRAVARECRPQTVVLCTWEGSDDLPIDELIDLRFSGQQIEDAARTFERMCHRIPVEETRPADLIYAETLGAPPAMLKLQALYSWLIAAIGLVLISPVMLITSILVKLTSPGPVLYRQVRVGLRGKHFTIYKFRSMTQDAEARSGAVWAKENDPRVTKLGYILRRTRIDELPQLYNVLRGDMVIVGPRPERPEFVHRLAKEIPYYNQRHSVKPGITGWAQINYKYGSTVEDTKNKLEYDLYYIKHISPSLDFLVIFHTFKIMLNRTGSQ